MEYKQGQTMNVGERLTELDLAKGFAILFMVMVHTLESFVSTNIIWETKPGMIIDYLGGVPSAPVFMFALGAGIFLSRKNTPSALFKRGMLLFFLGYALNFIRGFLPCLLDVHRYEDPSIMTEAWNELLIIDILQFAGLAFLTFSIISKFKFNTLLIIVLMLLFPILNVFVSPLQPDSLPIIALTGLIWGSGDISYFPFLVWIFYPLAGYLFARLAMNRSNKTQFYLISSAISIALAVLMFIFFRESVIKDLGYFDDYDYYYHSIAGNFAFTFFIILWIGLLFFLSKITPSIIIRTMTRWSRNITAIYIIHWIILGWLMFILEYRLFDIYMYILIFTFVFMASDFLSAVLSFIRKKKTSQDYTCSNNT